MQKDETIFQLARNLELALQWLDNIEAAGGNLHEVNNITVQPNNWGGRTEMKERIQQARDEHLRFAIVHATLTDDLGNVVSEMDIKVDVTSNQYERWYSHYPNNTPATAHVIRMAAAEDLAMEVGNFFDSPFNVSTVVHYMPPMPTPAKREINLEF